MHHSDWSMLYGRWMLPESCRRPTAGISWALLSSFESFLTLANEKFPPSFMPIAAYNPGSNITIPQTSNPSSIRTKRLDKSAFGVSRIPHPNSGMRRECSNFLWSSYMGNHSSGHIAISIAEKSKRTEKSNHIASSKTDGKTTLDRSSSDTWALDHFDLFSFYLWLHVLPHPHVSWNEHTKEWSQGVCICELDRESWTKK